MRRLAVVLVMILPLLPARAEALTVQEIIDLTRAGLGEEVLLALLEVDQRVYAIDPDTLKKLKKAGVSERVIVAMVRSGREPLEIAPIPVEPVDPPPPPAPQVVVIEHETPVVREVVVPVAVPVFVPVDHRGRSRRHSDPLAVLNPAVPAPVPPVIGIGSIPIQQPRLKETEPVYWGWGGKLRPDAWKPPRDQ